MDHVEASKSQAVEKYLLDQLQGNARDEFEEHYFECGICAEDVRAGVLLMDNAAAEFQANPAPAKVVKKPSLLDSFRINWLRPAFVLSAVALLAVSGLWLRDHDQLKNQLLEPQVFNSVLVEHVRGGAPATAVREGQFTAVSFYIDSNPLPGYKVKIEGNGVAPATLLLGGKPRDTPYNVLLPSARYQPGAYQFTIYAASANDAPIIGQFALTLK